MTSPGHPLRSARYLRRSKKKSADERATETNTVSVEDQRKRTSALEKREGYKHVKEFVDDGVSAWKDDPDGKNRPAFEELCGWIEDGRIDVVVTDAPDRLTRQGGLAYLVFLRLCADAKVIVHTISDGITDTRESDVAEIPAFLQGWVAKKESQDKSRRLHNRIVEAANEGQPRKAGVRPFGFEDDKITHHPVEAELLKDAVHLILSGRGTVGQIIREWNDAKVTTTRGKSWGRPSVKALLLRERNAGLVVLNGQVLTDVEAAWEPIITPEEHEQLKVMLGPQGNKQIEGRHLLSGLMSCHCGQPIRAATGGRRADIYRCTTGTEFKPKKPVPHVSLSRAEADPFIAEQVAKALFYAPDDALPEERAALALGSLYAALDEVTTKRSNLVEAVMNGVFKASDIAGKVTQLDADEQGLREQIDAVVSTNARAGLVSQLRRELWHGKKRSLTDGAKVMRELRKNFDALPLEDQRALVRATLRIVVHPGRGTDRIKVRHVIAPNLNEEPYVGHEAEAV